MSDLVGNPNCWFSHVKAQMVVSHKSSLISKLYDFGKLRSGYHLMYCYYLVVSGAWLSLISSFNLHCLFTVTNINLRFSVSA